MKKHNVLPENFKTWLELYQAVVKENHDLLKRDRFNITVNPDWRPQLSDKVLRVPTTPTSYDFETDFVKARAFEEVIVDLPTARDIYQIEQRVAGLGIRSLELRAFLWRVPLKDRPRDR